jgi:hypothetical protein
LPGRRVGDDPGSGGAAGARAAAPGTSSPSDPSLVRRVDRLSPDSGSCSPGLSTERRTFFVVIPVARAASSGFTTRPGRPPNYVGTWRDTRRTSRICVQDSRVDLKVTIRWSPCDPGKRHHSQSSGTRKGRSRRERACASPGTATQATTIFVVPPTRPSPQVRGRREQVETRGGPRPVRDHLRREPGTARQPHTPAVSTGLDLPVPGAGAGSRLPFPAFRGTRSRSADPLTFRNAPAVGERGCFAC